MTSCDWVAGPPRDENNANDIVNPQTTRFSLINFTYCLSTFRAGRRSAAAPLHSTPSHWSSTHDGTTRQFTAPLPPLHYSSRLASAVPTGRPSVVCPFADLAHFFYRPWLAADINVIIIIFRQRHQMPTTALTASTDEEKIPRKIRKLGIARSLQISPSPLQPLVAA